MAPLRSFATMLVISSSSAAPKEAVASRHLFWYETFSAAAGIGIGALAATHTYNKNQKVANDEKHAENLLEMHAYYKSELQKQIGIITKHEEEDIAALNKQYAQYMSAMETKLNTTTTELEAVKKPTSKNLRA